MNNLKTNDTYHQSIFTMCKIPITTFYSQFQGHPIDNISKLHTSLKSQGCKEFIFLAGDSSLDNKHWLFKTNNKTRELSVLRSKMNISPAINGFQNIMDPPFMIKDISYWLNHLAEKKYGPNKINTIMTAVEASTLQDRELDLLPQDKFIRDNITSNDTLIVSIGGNDVALRPSIQTMINLKLLTSCPNWLIENYYAPGFSHFVNLFHNKIEAYVKQLCSIHKPKKIVICMIYYLDKQDGDSWADTLLHSLGYTENPEKLQLIIRTLYEYISKKGYNIEGVDVTTLPLFKILDGNNTNDYIQRVEPSITGGKKIATSFTDIVFN